MDHLVCFLPGTLAWGATKGKSVTKEGRKRMHHSDLRDLELAEELARSCYEMYAQTAAGLSPEIVFWKTIPSGSYDGPPIPQDLFDYHSKSTITAPLNRIHTHAIPYDNETDTDTRFGDKFAHRQVEQDFSIHPQDGHNLLRPETVESLFILYRITKKKIYREWGWKIFLQFEKHCQVEGGYTSLVRVLSTDNSMMSGKILLLSKTRWKHFLLEKHLNIFTYFSQIAILSH
jgi:mannosyl-oligosaccharide alpha-1,2-mannosidase